MCAIRRRPALFDTAELSVRLGRHRIYDFFHASYKIRLLIWAQVLLTAYKVSDERVCACAPPNKEWCHAGNKPAVYDDAAVSLHRLWICSGRTLLKPTLFPVSAG